ncbi:hypothetical protein PUN28_011764 [Cardiocondyla obscurior]|uniref:Uncharacterized protein n=1 Tax=Cardiocondyla obscurior TaxID=286306 RepID=A0AAW2FFF9_9HYME
MSALTPPSLNPAKCLDLIKRARGTHDKSRDFMTRLDLRAMKVQASRVFQVRFLYSLCISALAFTENFIRS